MNDNSNNDIYGKYSLIPLLCALEDLKENHTACLEQIHYYEEGIKFGDTNCIKEKETVEKELALIKGIKDEIKMHLIPLSN